MNKESNKNRFFLVYDIFNETYKRRLSAPLDNEAFDIDADARILVFYKDKRIELHSVMVPKTIRRFLRPIYLSYEHRKNPAKLVEEKVTLINKLEKELARSKAPTLTTAAP